MTKFRELQIHERNLRVLELCHRDELRKAKGPEASEMEMAFIDALSWARSRCGADIKQSRPCPACAGSGRYEEGPLEEHDVCGVCNGTGSANHLADAERVSGEQSGRIVELERAITEIAVAACAEVGEQCDSDPSPARAKRAVARALHSLANARVELACARVAVGAAWLTDGASLADAIEAKTKMLEAALHEGPATRPMRPVGVVTSTGVLTDAVDLPAFPDEESLDVWGWYVEGGRLSKGFPTRAAAIEAAVAEGKDDFLVGPIREIDLPALFTAEDLRETIEERASTELCLEDLYVRLGDKLQAQRALAEWMNLYLEGDFSTYCDGGDPTAEELAAARAALETRAPCACPAGAACTYRDEPPGDPDRGHCQDCGAYMPDDATLGPRDRHACPECGAFFIVGEPEDA